MASAHLDQMVRSRAKVWSRKVIKVAFGPAGIETIRGPGIGRLDVT
ncbi:hypothetical protein [Nocardia nepalensis]